MTITSKQCRAARELLGWTQGDLQKKSRLGIETIGHFERGDSNPTDRTFYDLTKAFEDAGIKFVDDEIQIGATLLKKKKKKEFPVLVGICECTTRSWSGACVASFATIQKIFNSSSNTNALKIQ